jgi:CHAT domain-containing protein
MGMKSQEQHNTADDRNLKAIEKEVTAYEPNVNYGKPFEHIYYWAPFILVGDWK